MGATEDTGGPHEYILLVAALGDAMRLPSRFHLIVWEAKLLSASADVVDRPTRGQEELGDGLDDEDHGQEPPGGQALSARPDLECPACFRLSS